MFTAACYSILGIIISYWCFQVVGYVNAFLFTYLGEVETPAGIEKCYAYDALTIPSRIVVFLIGIAAICVFDLTWLCIYGILFVW